MYHHVIKWALTTSQTDVNHVKIKQYILRLASGNTAHPATATGAHLWNELHISLVLVLIILVGYCVHGIGLVHRALLAMKMITMFNDVCH